MYKIGGTVAYSCNPSTLGNQGVGSLESRSSRPPGQHSETSSLQKLKLKISQTWWYTPVVPAPWEAEMGGLLEPGQQSETLSQKKFGGRGGGKNTR